MKVSGFTLIRNGTKFDYPYLESLRSLLPLVDELVINVGVGDDDTAERGAQRFARDEGQGKVRPFESRWPLDDPEKKKGGLILSEQTNLALDRCTGDWCIYLQADESCTSGCGSGSGTPCGSPRAPGSRRPALRLRPFLRVV